MERTVSRVRAATETPAGVKTDLELIGELADRLAPDLFDEPLEPESVFEELAALTAGTPADLSGISYDRLEAERAVRWPAPEPDVAGGYRYYEGPDDDGERDGAESWSFHTPSGRARFSSGERRPLPEPTDEEYPLTLTTARRPDAYNTGVRARADDPVARVSAATAAAFDDEVLEEDGRRYAEVVSRRGSVTARLETDDAIPDGVVWLPIHHPAVNDLTLPDVDPRSKEPHFKQCAVRLERPRDRKVNPAAEASV